MYTKDITFLLRLLGASKQSGILLVEAPGPAASPWQGRFQLDKGAVLSCQILNKADGRVVLRNDEALRWLTSQGRLSWRLEENAQRSDPFPPALPPPGETTREEQHEEEFPSALRRNQLSSIPQRTSKGKFLSVNAFASREHRQVFALIDGQRTVEEIVSLLHKPPEAIFRILQELQAAGFIF